MVISLADCVLYPVGRRLACLDLNTYKISFIDIEVDHNTITAIECATKKNTKNIFVAISSYNQQEYPSLMIFNLSKKRKSLMHFKECEKGSIIQQVIVAQNSKYCVLLIQSAKSTSSVMYIDYDEGEIILQSNLKQKVAMITVNPLHSMQFVAIGLNYFRSYELVDKLLKEDHLSLVGAKYEKEYNFISAQYCQNSNTIVAIAEPNNVFVIEEKTLKQFFHPLFDKRNLLIKHNNDENPKLNEEGNVESKEEANMEFKKEAITSHLKGLSTDDSKQKEFWKWLNGDICLNKLSVGTRLFAITTKYGAKVGIYEITNDFSVDQIVMFAFPDDYTEVSKIAISLDESYITFIARQYSKITYFNNLEKVEELDDSLFYSSLRNNCFVVNVAQLEAIKNDSLPVKEVIENGGPLGDIISIGISQMKKQFVTVGSDHMIRAWDYEEEYKQIICCEVQEQVYEISMHPMGLQFAVGQKEGLKIYYIMDTDFQLAVEVGGNSCYSVKYSHGGQYLAAGSSSIISIIDPYTLEVKYALEGHPSNICYLEWSDKDYYLVSACRKNEVFVWPSKFEKFQQENASPDYRIFLSGKGTIIGCIYDPEFDTVVAATVDGYVLCYNEKNSSPYYELYYSDTKLSSMLLIKATNSLMLGTETGIIRILNWPIIKPTKEKEVIEHLDVPSHAFSITKMASTEDGKMLFTVGKDSLVYIYNVKQYIDGLEITPELNRKQQMQVKCKHLMGKIPTTFSVNSLCLVQKTTLESKKQLIKSLREELLKQRDEKIEEDRRKDKEHEDSVCSLKEEHKKELHNLRTEYETSKKKADDLNKLELLKIVNMNEDLRKDIDKIHLDYQSKLNDEVDKYNKLSDTLLQTKSRYYKEIEDIIAKNKEVLESIQNEYSSKYKELQQKYSKLVSSMKSDGIKFEEILEQCELEYEGEIQKLGIDLHYAKQNENTAKHKVEELEAKDESEKKKISAQKDEAKSNIEKLGEDLLKQQNTNRKLTDQLEKMKEQLIKREASLIEKQNENNELKEKNKHLENFRFVLDNKIKSLQEERISMESQISQSAEHIKNMYNETMMNTKIHKSLDDKVKELSSCVDKQKDDIRSKTYEAVALNQKSETLQYDLLNLLKTTNYAEWPFLLRDLYNKHFTKDGDPLLLIPKQLYSQRQEPVASIEQRNEKIENLKLQNELLKQRDCVTEKLGSEVMRAEKLEKQRKELILKLQKENVVLISDCNKMRDENRQISKRVATLEKKFKEITGISLANIDNIDQELDSFIRTSYSSHNAACKPTTFQKLKSQPKSTRMQSLIDYYGKYADGEAPQKIKDLLVKNKEQIRQQNEEMKSIQVY